MTVKEIGNLVKGANYNILVDEDGTKFEGVAEYRGFDIEVDYLLFWFEGKSCATPFHFEDIVRHERV